jgi:hypothetical protein
VRAVRDLRSGDRDVQHERLDGFDLHGQSWTKLV